MEFMWDELGHTGRPLVLYGTGNAAERIIGELGRRGIPIAGIFASDGFVRSRTFMGFPVLSYEEAKAHFGPMTVLISFGSHLPEVMAQFERVAREQDCYAVDLPVVGEGLFDKACWETHRPELDRIRSLLADEKSVQVLDEIIAYRLSGRIEHLLACQTPEEENWKLLGLGPDEVYLDLGAYTGDTADLFCRQVPSWRQIVAVEPDDRNYRKLAEKLSFLPRSLPLKLAVSDRCGIIPFSRSKGRGGARGKGSCRMAEAATVDSLLQRSDIPAPPSFIKLDLEGEEARALTGASETIRRFKPKLLLSAYHRVDDLWSLPFQVLDLRPDYRLFLRHSPCIPAWEVNYYML